MLYHKYILNIPFLGTALNKAPDLGAFVLYKFFSRHFLRLLVSSKRLSFVAPLFKIHLKLIFNLEISTVFHN